MKSSALLAIRNVRREFVLGDDSLQIQFINSLEQRDAGAVNVTHVSYERLIMNCAIYARVSTRDKGQDFTNQLIALREFTAKQGVRLAERTRAGLERVRREGKRLGRPVANVNASAIRQMRAEGES
jgi:predicted site-specific integrase-resolvase